MPQTSVASLFPPYGPLPAIVLPEGLPAAYAMIEAQRLESIGQPVVAESIYRHLLVRQPGFHPAWHTLGLLAYRAGELRLAGEFISCAISIDDKVGVYHRNLGEILRILGYMDEAVAAGQRAVALLPNDMVSHANLGLALAAAKRPVEAVASCQRAVDLDPANGLALTTLGTALEALPDKARAEEVYAAAIRLNPRLAEPRNNLGAIYSEQGRLEQARKCFEAAIAARPDFAEAHFNLSSLKTYGADDPHLAAMEALLPSAAAMTAERRIRFHFALGKARKDAGRYDEAFAAYAEGNRLQHALRPWDDAKAGQKLVEIMDVFDRDFLAARTPATHDGDITPIFIVGMPRSGTTLIEQVLASHPAVFGAGELTDLSDMIMALSRSADTDTSSAWAAQASPEDFAALGRAYLERLRKLAPGKAIVTDKTPANFFFLGIIRLALPNAKIIHAMREPMDSCFSCYSTLFANVGLDFTSDLDDLGRYCARYLKLMEHWHRVLPAGAILDVRYEDMVADTEGQVRRLLDHLGLPWDESCLAFHKNKRPVQTASMIQVRQPIYKTSLARWQRFERHLQPLRDALDSIR
jgi:tetratricopeptide (TPR) repeat protein